MKYEDIQLVKRYNFIKTELSKIFTSNSVINIEAKTALYKTMDLAQNYFGKFTGENKAGLPEINPIFKSAEVKDKSVEITFTGIPSSLIDGVEEKEFSDSKIEMIRRNIDAIESFCADISDKVEVVKAGAQRLRKEHLARLAKENKEHFNNPME